MRENNNLKHAEPVMTDTAVAPEAEFVESNIIKRAGLVLGPIIAVILLFFSPPEGLSQNAWYVCSLASWMVTWWITEAFPLAITSLLPLVILPTLGIMPFDKVAASFSNSIIFLFLGGFIISTAMKKWHLHSRVALFILNTVGEKPGMILAGVMVSTGFMAFWMSNTATVIMMLPIAISIATLLLPEGSNSGFMKALILAVAYSAALGGLGTFVGTPVNAILLGHLKTTYHQSLYLMDWMKFGVPIVICSIASAWIILYFLFVRGTKLVDNVHEKIHGEYERLGKINRGQTVVAGIFLLTVSLWLFGKNLEKAIGIKVDEASVALLAALLLFIIPIKVKPFTGSINWADAIKIPWGVLIFFGGSLCLSSALTDSGVTVWLSNELKALDGVSVTFLVIILCVTIVAVSELMSNVATISAFLPILTSLSVALNVNPIILMVPATLAASCGFMMPGASAANALAYSTGKLRVPEMLKSGFLLNLSVVMIIVIATFTLVRSVLGV